MATRAARHSSRRGQESKRPLFALRFAPGEGIDPLAEAAFPEELLMAMSSRQDDLAACRNRGDAAEVERCKRLLKLNYSLIRAHCAKHDLERPHDVPPVDAA